MDVLHFAGDYLRRRHSPPQEEFLVKLFGLEPEKFWPTTPRTLGLCWGLGSGKNMSMESAVCYADYLLMCLNNPQRYFWNIDEPRFIDILNFSFVKEEHAKDIFFQSMKMVLRSCKNPKTGTPWFAEQGVDLRDNGIGDLKEKIVELPHGIRNRCLVATKEGFEGSRILLGIFDEPSRAVNSIPKNADAHTLFERVQVNVASSFGDMGKVAAFSYPEADEDDIIMELVKQHRAGMPSVWASKYATYEVNPLRKYDDPAYVEMRQKMPELFTSAIECNPPASVTGFYRAHPEKIAESFKPSLTPVVEYQIYVSEREVEEPNGDKVKKKFTAIRLLKATGDAQVRSIGGDAGSTGDSFALAMARSSKTERPLELLVEAEESTPVREPITGHTLLKVENGERVQSMDTRIVEKRITRKLIDRMPIVDLIIEMKPITVREKGKQPTIYPIDFISVKDFIVALKGPFPNLKVGRFEQWQTITMIQEMMRAGINAECVPFSNKTQVALYTQHRGLVYNDFIWHTPHPVAERQFRELQDVNGGKVDHKPDGGKDLSDSIVLAVDGILQNSARNTGKFLL